jgi:hypothetical protein
MRMPQTAAGRAAAGRAASGSAPSDASAAATAAGGAVAGGAVAGGAVAGGAVAGGAVAGGAVAGGAVAGERTPAAAAPEDDAPGNRQAGAGRRATRLAVALRGHWLAVALLTAGLVLRLLAQVAYRPALLYIDTPKYLGNAWPGADPVGYKAPLRAILLVGNLNAVTAVQHLLGLAMAAALYLLLQRRGVPRALAALAIAPVLLDAYQLQMEQTVMPDAWFEALIVTGLAVLLWKPATTLPAVITAGLTLGSSATVRQVGETLILPALAYLLAATTSTPGTTWRHATIKAAALCAAFALPILAYCTGSYALTGQFSLSNSGSTLAYARMAAVADCATLRLPAAERPFLPPR